MTVINPRLLLILASTFLLIVSWWGWSALQNNIRGLRAASEDLAQTRSLVDLIVSTRADRAAINAGETHRLQAMLAAAATAAGFDLDQMAVSVQPVANEDAGAVFTEVTLRMTGMGREQFTRFLLELEERHAVQATDIRLIRDTADSHRWNIEPLTLQVPTLKVPTLKRGNDDGPKN